LRFTVNDPVKIIISFYFWALKKRHFMHERPTRDVCDVRTRN
jgi:hypothetical protein